MELNELNERLANANAGRVYTMNEFNDVVEGLSGTELLFRVSSGHFDINHDYFEFDGYANLVSYETLEEVLELYDDIN